jgi:hypothetical protein
VISSSVNAGGPTNYTNSPAAGLRIWSRHVQRAQQTTGTFRVSETEAAASNLTSSEEQMMETLCLYVNLLGGGGQGICSCTPEDADF